MNDGGREGVKKLLAKTRKIVERDATDHAIFFRGLTGRPVP